MATRHWRMVAISDSKRRQQVRLLDSAKDLDSEIKLKLNS